jgi:hypothetical protein
MNRANLLPAVHTSKKKKIETGVNRLAYFSLPVERDPWILPSTG